MFNRQRRSPIERLFDDRQGNLLLKRIKGKMGANKRA